MTTLPKDELTATVRVIDALISKKNLTDDELEQIAGNHWRGIKAKLKLRGQAVLYISSVSMRYPEPLLAFKDECLAAIREIEREEYERKLDEEYKLVHIRYAKRALKISVISISLSTVSTIISLLSLILSILL